MTKTTPLYQWDDNQRKLYYDDPLPKAIVFCDIDGTLTDNRVAYGSKRNHKFVLYSTYDGQGVADLLLANVKVVLITQTRQNHHGFRAEDLDVPIFCASSRRTDKGTIVDGILKYTAIYYPGQERPLVIAIGNDYSDIAMMKHADIPITVYDAHTLVKTFVIAHKKGIIIPDTHRPGYSAFRWVADELLKNHL